MKEIIAQYPIAGNLLTIAMVLAILSVVVFITAAVVLLFVKDAKPTQVHQPRGFVHNKSGHFIQL